MSIVPKWLIIGGVILIVVGLLWQVLGKVIPLGKLPGDIVFEGENMKVYFPLMTMIVISIVLSVLLSFGARFLR